MASRQREFTATEIKAGFLVLASLVILAVFLVALSGWHPADDTARHYHTAFSDVGGLGVGADVRFGGVKVGRVIGIGPDPADRARIRVEMEVEGATPVNEASVASVGQISLTAEKHLEISTGTASAPLLPDGSSLESRMSGGGLIDMPEMDGVVARLEALLDNLNALVGPEPAGGEASEAHDLRTIFAALKVTLDESAGTARRVSAVIDENRGSLKDVIDRLAGLEDSGNRLLGQLEGVLSENGPALHRSLLNIEQMTVEMNGRLEELGRALQSFQEIGSNGSALLEGQRVAIEEILLNLRVITRNLADLSRVLADKPDALVFGSAPAGQPNRETR